MRNSIILAGILVSTLTAGLPVYGQANVDDVAQLKQRVDQLEKEVQEISKVLEPVKAAQVQEQRRKNLRARFEERLHQDRTKYTQEQLNEAEKLYQVANQKWGSPEATESLQKMIKDFPDVNRTGCAALYLAQSSKGDEQIKNLKDCIEKYNDCMYGDGVQVGAYARFLLIQQYQQQYDAEKAEALENELKTRFPDAVDHGGNLLIDSLKKE